MVRVSLYAKILLCFLILLCYPAQILLAAVVPTLFELEDGYLSIGLVDVTVGVNQLDGLIESITETDHFQEGIYCDGRLAFFLKGKIKGSALITAWLDTAAESSETIFAKLDPTKYYPIYGDDSQSYSEVASPGKSYLRLEEPEYRAIWGSYQADLSGSALTAYHRSLYGFQLEASGPQETTLKAFHSNPESLHSRDTLTSTGGLLYYLRHGRVDIGSEQVRVEVRDSFTGRTLTNFTLTLDDYLIDYLQGRLILKKDIEEMAVSEEIIKDRLQGEKQIYLIVDYDYEPTATVDGATIGYQFASQLAPGLKVSNTVYQENVSIGKPYNLFGLDINYASPGGFHFDASLAESGSVLSGKNVSDDGGLTYHEDPSLESTGGGAYQLSMKFDLNRLNQKFPAVRVEGNYAHWEQGFTNQRYTFGEDTDRYDVSVSGTLSEQVSYRTQYVHDELGDEKLLNEIKVVHPVSNKLTVKGELQHTSELASEDVKGAVKAEYRLPKVMLFGSQQLTLFNSDETSDNRTTVGAELELSERLGVNLEVSAGNAGETVELGGKYDYGFGQVYTGVNVNEQETGRVVETTFGNRGQVSSSATVFSERKITVSNAEESTSNVLGIDYAPNKSWALSFDYSKSDVQTAEGNQINREILTPGIFYASEDLEGRLKLQFRNDQGKEELDQYVITSGLKYRYNRDLSLSANLDHSITTKSAVDLAEYSKASVGFAYRPIKYDRLNLLGMYTNLLDTAPQEQEGVPENEERARVISLEGIYDINRYWQLAEKFAYKKASIMVNGDLHNSDTYLWITRANYRFNSNWAVYGEFRQLTNTQAEDSKSGFAVGLSKDLGENTQIGLGYNFTDFNDDLTNLNYNARGLYINFLRKW